MNPENENVTPHNKAKTVYAKEKKKDRNIKESWQGIQLAVQNWSLTKTLNWDKIESIKTVFTTNSSFVTDKTTDRIYLTEGKITIPSERTVELKTHTRTILTKVQEPQQNGCQLKSLCRN